MVGKSKDSKANKGKKALENEWEEALAAAESGDPLIASASNRPGGRRGEAGPAGVYVAQAGGGSAKARLKLFEEALAKAEAGSSADAAAVPSGDASSTGGEISEKDAKKLKKKQEKEAAAALERKQEEERARRREEKERREEAERLEALSLADDP